MLHVVQYAEQSSAKDKHYQTDHYDSFCSKSFSLHILIFKVHSVTENCRSPSLHRHKIYSLTYLSPSVLIAI